MSRQSFNEAPVLTALARAPGYHSPAQIAERLGISRDAVASILRRLCAKGIVHQLGKPRDLGINGIHGHALIFAINRPSKQAAKRSAIPLDIRIAQPITIGRGSLWNAGRGGRAL